MSGIFAIENHENAAELAYLGCYAMQQRGTHQAGIATLHNNLIYCQGLRGLIKTTFTQDLINKKLPGNTAIAQIHHKKCTIQPILATKPNPKDNFVICLDGEIRFDKEPKVAITTELGLEKLIHELGNIQPKDFLQDAVRIIQSLNGGFTLALLNKDVLVVARDKHGIRPLSMGQLDSSLVFASETAPFDLFGAKFLRDVKPGEIIITKNGETNYIPHPEPVNQILQCSFEHIYFGRPDSVIFNQSVNKTRHRLGRLLAKYPYPETGIVIGVPDSGIPQATAYAQETNLPFQNALIRNHYVGKMERSATIDDSHILKKFNADKTLVEGNNVVLIDDSLLGGRAAKLLVQMLRKVGAKEVHVRIASPEIISICPFGQPISHPENLLARSNTLIEMKNYIGADSLYFLTKEELLKTLPTVGNFCTKCMNHE